jgi:DNA-directed RNA polymerase specialized sigma24 family protein
MQLRRLRIENYRAYRLPAMRYARARIGDEESAEDVADQVFTYLAVARPACRGNFESLVIYYTRLRCANYRPQPRYRRVHRRRACRKPRNASRSSTGAATRSRASWRTACTS